MLRGLAGRGVDDHGGRTRTCIRACYGGRPRSTRSRCCRASSPSLHDANGRVTVPGFYDGVPELPDGDRGAVGGARLRPRSSSATSACRSPRARRTASTLEMIWSRPTCEVNGIWGGYTGDGFKTVLPVEAACQGQLPAGGHAGPAEASGRASGRMVRDMLPPDCRSTFKGHGASRLGHGDGSSRLRKGARRRCPMNGRGPPPSSGRAGRSRSRGTSRRSWAWIRC